MYFAYFAYFAVTILKIGLVFGYWGRFVEPQRSQRAQRVTKVRGFTFGIAPKVTKSLGLEPPKAENPGGIPKIRKLATLRQYGFFYGIPPGFSPAERFFRQRPRGYEGYGGYEGCRGNTLWGHNFFKVHYLNGLRLTPAGTVLLP